jgi:hypothetical protein
MSAAIRKLIARLEASLVSEDDAKKRKAIAADLSAAKKTLKHVEHTETTDDGVPPPPPPADDDEDESEEEDEEEEAASGNETNRKAGKAPPPPADGDTDTDEDDDEEEEEEDEEEACHGAEEDEEEEAKAIAAALASVPGRKGARLAGRFRALQDKAKAADAQAAAIAEIQRERKAEKRGALIMGALHAKGGPRISKADATWLRGQKLATVESYLATRTAPIVRTEERVVQGAAPGKANLSAEAEKILTAAVRNGGKREDILTAYEKAQAAQAGKGSY